MGILIEKSQINQSKLSLISFLLFSGWLLSVPFEGQVLYHLMLNSEINFSAHSIITVFAHFFGLVITGFFIKKQAAAKIALMLSVIVYIIGSFVFFFSFSKLWYIALSMLSFFSGIFVASWGFYFKGYIQPNQRFKVVADVLIYANVIMMLINIIAANVSPLLALGVSIVGLITTLLLVLRLEVHSSEALLETGYKESLNHNKSHVFKAMMFLCLFIFIITLNSGFMYQVVNPVFAHFTMLTSYYWAVPYIVALLVLRNLRGKINRAFILYIALIMIGLSFILFMWLNVSVFSYLIINTLMLAAFGVCDLFWWSILADVLDYCDNAAKVLGIGLSMNVLGILVGGVIGQHIISMKKGIFDVSLIALVIIFTVMIILPILNMYLTRFLKNHVFLIKFASLENHPSKDEVIDVGQNQNLTEKEMEVVQLILRGYTYKAISEALFISENTTKFHIKNIYQKLGVNNKMALIKKFNGNEK